MMWEKTAIYPQTHNHSSVSSYEIKAEFSGSKVYLTYLGRVLSIFPRELFHTSWFIHPNLFPQSKRTSSDSVKARIWLWKDDVLASPTKVLGNIESCGGSLCPTESSPIALPFKVSLYSQVLLSRGLHHASSLFKTQEEEAVGMRGTEILSTSQGWKLLRYSCTREPFRYRNKG